MIQSTSRAVSLGSQQALLSDQSPADALRDLVAQCQALASRHHSTPAAIPERAWWQTLYVAGIRLRDTLEKYRGHWELSGLSDQEVEHAYYALIQVAYFFEPGGVAEQVFQEQGWAWSDEKSSEYALSREQ